MSVNMQTLEHFAPQTFRFYCHALEIMETAKLPFLVGGAYAFCAYTGIVRHTKDFDLFIRPEYLSETLRAFEQAGYRAEVVFSHWLGKAYHGGDFVDIIYNSGNGVCPVDESWFTFGEQGQVLGEEVLLVPAEEMIWQKAYIMERERFDGADVVHLIRARGERLDWDRLLARFGIHWRVLLAHLVLFPFIYPLDRDSIPSRILIDLAARLHEEPREGNLQPVCRGTLLSRIQYLPDTEEWGYADARVEPSGTMTAEQVLAWTDAGR